MIEVEGVRKAYGRVVALDGVSFRVAPGELVGLVGHNGAGKSTLFRLLTGLTLPGEGTVRIDGIDVAADPNAARERVGFVPEEPTLWDYLTAREFLEFVSGVRGRGDILAALELTGLGDDADRLIREYSQGMRRKTALAAAMVSDPPVLLLDEALNGLDPPSAARVKGELRRRCDAGASVIFSTHVLETVERVTDRVILLRRGRVERDVKTADLGEGGLERLFLEISATP